MLESMQSCGNHPFLFWFIKCFLRLSMGYPYFSPAYIRRHIDKPATDKAELIKYAEMSGELNKLRPIQCLIIFISIAYFLRTTVVPVLVIGQVKLNSNQATTTTTTTATMGAQFEFKCLASNCSELEPLAEPIWWPLFYVRPPLDPMLAQSRESKLLQLTKRLNEFPIFPICNKPISFLYDSLQSSGLSGFILASIIGFTILIGGIILPLIQLINPTGNLFLMFIIAPNVTRLVVHDRAKQLVCDLKTSLNNYRITTANNEYQRAKEYTLLCNQDARRYSCTTRATCNKFNCDPYLGHASGCGPMTGRSQRFNNKGASNRLNVNDASNASNYRRLNETLCNEFALDCVTIMRSKWWHSIGTQSLSAIIKWSYYLSTLCSLTIPFWLQYHIKFKQEHLNSIGANMRLHLNCSIWFKNGETFHDSGDGDKLDVLDLEQYAHDANPVYDLVYMIQSVWPFCCIYAFLIIYIMTNAELSCWLHELKFQLLLGTRFVEQILAQLDNNDQNNGRRSAMVSPASLNTSQDEYNHSQTLQHFQMGLLREQFKHLTCVKLFFTFYGKMSNSRRLTTEASAMSGFCNKSKLSSELDIDQFVSGAISRHHMDSESAIELLEKLYVSLRLLVEHVHYYGPTMTTMLSMINLYVYGDIIIYICYLRAIGYMVEAPFFVMITSGLGAIFFVLLASNFNAKAKKLHLLIWSLIAVTSDRRDIRIRHMRHLWIKQVTALDMHGGLALESLGFRITHVRIIQLIVGSGTLVVLALR